MQYFNSFMTKGLYCIETSPLICRENQWTGFYMISTSIMRDFNIFYRILNTYLQLIHRIYSVIFENLPASVALNTSIFHLLFRCENFVETRNFRIHCVKSVRIFPHSGWTRRDAEYFSVFSSHAGNYEPENSDYKHFSRRVSFGRFFRKLSISTKFLHQEIRRNFTVLYSGPLSSYLKSFFATYVFVDDLFKIFRLVIFKYKSCCEYWIHRILQKF